MSGYDTTTILKGAGTLTVPKGKTVRIHSEYAAWWTDVELMPGAYPVSIERFGGRTYLRAEVTATITNESNAPHYGGVAMGPSTQQRTGTQTGYHWTADTYAVARAILEGASVAEIGTLKLAANVVPASLTFERWRSCAEAMGNGYQKDATGQWIKVHEHAARWTQTHDRAAYDEVRACPQSGDVEDYTTELMIDGVSL